MPITLIHPIKITSRLPYGRQKYNMPSIDAYLVLHLLRSSQYDFHMKRLTAVVLRGLAF